MSRSSGAFLAAPVAQVAQITWPSSSNGAARFSPGLESPHPIRPRPAMGWHGLVQSPCDNGWVGPVPMRRQIPGVTSE